MMDGFNPKALSISIIGAGMAGLTCALSLAKNSFTNIHIYENAPDLGIVGAGLQLAPNMVRILDRLGCWGDVQREAVEISKTSIRQHSSNEELANIPLSSIKALYGHPPTVGHRASLANALYNACKRESGIHFHLATNIGQVWFSPNPKFEAKPLHSKPYIVKTDILLGADGVKSNVRAHLLKELGMEAKVEGTGTAAYRIMLTRDQMRHDPELFSLINGNAVTRWIGEKRHVIAYPISSHQIYNISTAQPDTNFASAPDATYTTTASKSNMLATFADFCPLVQRMLQLAPDGEIVEWKLCVHHRLPTWVHGSVALLGDACHPTLPHLAQGAAMAIEDAAVLGVVLGHMKSRHDINKTLKSYEKLRKERTEMLVDLAAASGRALHLGEGEKKQERDQQFATVRLGKKGPNPDKWADSDVQRMIYGHDCVQAAVDTMETAVSKL